MMTKQLNIFLVEDLPSDAELIKLELKKEKINFILRTVDNKKDFLFALKQSKPDIILSDFNLPQFDGLEALEISKKKFPEIPFIVVTGTLNDETVVGCIKAGAWDYVIKEHLVRLGPAVKQALKLKVKIDDKKKAEEALRKSEERFRSLIQNSSDIITVIDKSGKVLYHSPSAERIFGYKLKEIQKKKYIFELIHIDDIEETKIIFSNILNDFSKIFKIEYRILSKKGNWIYLESFCSNQLNNKSINGIVLNSRDITERKRAEQIQNVLYEIANAVNYSKDLIELFNIIKKELNNVLDTTNFFIALYNEENDTITLPYIVDENDNFTSFPAGKTLTNYVIKNNKSLLVNKVEINKLVESGVVEFVGTPCKIWLGVPLLATNKIIGALVIQSYTDENALTTKDLEILKFVSNQVGISIVKKRAEEELIIAKEKAEESDRLKTAFLANMSHEIRTPMNAISGFSQLIVEPDLSKAEREEFSNHITNNCNDLLHLIDDIIDISKIEAGEMQINLTDCYINKILTDLFILFYEEKNRCEKKNIELNIYKEIDENDFAIISDPFRVKQILKNLLSNALKYTEEGSIEFGYHIKTSNDESFMEFFVKDTGIGMKKNQSGFIFERFKKIEDNKEKLYRGAGLGLTITQNLVQLLGGKIWVDSTKDKGSTFFFILPYKIAEPSFIKLTDKEEITKDYNWKDKIILIAEDDFSNYLVIKHLLMKTQVQLLWAKNGKYAVETCKNNSNIRLILMDVKMPEMNGYEATGLIKQFRKKLPIIAITAYALLGDREKSLKAGCDDYLSKPIEQEKLLLLIDKYLT